VQRRPRTNQPFQRLAFQRDKLLKQLRSQTLVLPPG
jgi:hypothetical protein